MSPSHSTRFKNPRAKHDFLGRTCSISGVGSYVPAKVLTNAELARMIETTDEWITTRTGIKERRIAAKNEFTSDLATQAALCAMRRAGVTADQVDLIIVATATPDMPFPSTACLVQRKIGAHRAAAFDLEAACSGFIYGLEIGQQFIMSRTYDTVLVIGAEKLSSIVDWKDRNTCVLFGDGAGAAVLRAVPEGHGILSSYMRADGSGSEMLTIPGGGSRYPASAETIAAHQHYIHMAGNEVFKFAVRAVEDAIATALERAGLTTADVNVVIPHQANIRIIEAVQKRVNIPEERWVINIQEYSNTSAATIPIALNEAFEQERIHDGDIVLLVGFGGGLTWGATVMRW